jgi:phage FluMu protein Com
MLISLCSSNMSRQLLSRSPGHSPCGSIKEAGYLRSESGPHFCTVDRDLTLDVRHSSLCRYTWNKEKVKGRTIIRTPYLAPGWQYQNDPHLSIRCPACKELREDNKSNEGVTSMHESLARLPDCHRAKQSANLNVSRLYMMRF